MSEDVQAVEPNGSHEVLLVLVLVVASVFLALGKLTGDQWVDLIKWAFAFFAGTHVALNMNAPRAQGAKAASNPPS